MVTPSTGSSQPVVSRTFNRVGWALQILLALAFFGAGFSKLFSAPDMVALFDQIGRGNWFRYLTGVMEVLSAVALLVPGWARFGALNLIMTMLGAIATHLFQIGGNPVGPVVLLVLSGAVFWLRRYQSLFPWRGSAQ